MKQNWIWLIFILCLPSSVFGANESPQTFTLDGKLYQVNSTTPLSDSAVKINVQVMDPAGQCLLYEEQQTVNTLTTDGYFSIHVGSATGAAKRTVNDPGRTMAQVFQNLAAISSNNVSGQTCAGGVYTPAPGAIRYFRVTVTPSTTNVADTLSPDIVIDAVPTAMVAQSLQGLERANILQVNNSGSTVLTQANLEALFTTPAYANLQSILAGNFMQIDSSGASLPAYAANPAGAANGDIWFDTLTNEVKYKNAAGVQVVGVSSGGITSLTVGSSMSANGSVAGTISGSGTIDLSNTGVTAGTYTKMTVDAKGRVTAGTVSLVEGDIPNLTAAGKVSGNTITSGTISGSAGVNTSGNLITTGTVSGLTVQATNLRIYNGANYIQMTAPTLSGLVNFTLPDNDGDANQVLTTNGAGVLSWASGTTTLAGDVSGPSGTTSVDKIKGKAVTAATVSGQMMIYDGTAWANSVMSGDATLSYAGILTLNKVPVSKGGTNATTFGNNRMIASNGTGSALQDFTCSLNQVITFDASGNAVCANVTSLSAGILNGGNTTGADISVGTNDNNALKLKVNNTIAMTISQSGNVGIGTASPGTVLDLGSKTDALRLPAGTAAQRPAAPVNGDIRYNTSNQTLESYVNGTWTAMTSNAPTSASSFRQVGANPNMSGAANQESYYAFGQASTHASNQAATSSLNTGMIAIPFIVTSQTSVDRLAFSVVTAGSADSKVRIGIYNNTSSTVLYPSTLLLDAGEFATDISGVVTTTVTATLPANSIIWGVFWGNSGSGASFPVMKAIRPDQGQVLNLLGWNATLTNQATLLNAGSLYVTGTAMPVSYPTNATRGSGNVPLLLMRFN